MKQIGVLSRTICVAVAALMTASAVPAQNVLVNPGFETDAVADAAPVPGATGWATFGPFAGTASATTDATRTGIGSLVLSGSGGFSVPGANQTFPAFPGQVWDFQGYIFTSNALPAGATFGVLKIVWSNGANDLQPAAVTIGTSVGGAFPGIESAPTLNNTSTVGTWQFTRAQGVAPAGTTQVKVFALFVDEVAGTALFDDLQATNFPSASPLTASISSPANGDTVAADFTINASASVVPGAVTNVYFYDNDVEIGSDDTSPYTFAVTGAANGLHQLKVIARGTNQSGASISYTSSVVNVTVSTSTTVYVDPSKNWLGFMNYFALPVNGGAYEGGQVWGTAALKASFSGSTLTLSPNSIDDPAPAWYQSIGNNSVANRMMEANMYVEPVGSLPGLNVTFTGMCISDNMTTNGGFNGAYNPAGNGWTCVAFIKDFAPDYSSSVAVTVPVTNGMKFSLSLATISDPARHVQYGFTTTGPCVWTNDVALPTYGNVVVAPGPAVVITPSVSGANVNLSFPSVVDFTYQLQRKNSLTDANWTNLGSATNGTGSTIVLTDTHALPSRFYRVSVQ